MAAGVLPLVFALTASFLGDYAREEVPEGLSGITGTGGDRYCCVDDRGGMLHEYRLEFGADGEISAAETVRSVRLSGRTDLEGCAWDPLRKLIWVSDEADDSVRAFDPATGDEAGRLALPEEVAGQFRRNRSLEALSVSPDGLTLWTASEDTLKCDGEPAGRSAGGRVRLMRFTRRSGGEDWRFDRYFLYATDTIAGEPFRGYSISGVPSVCALEDGSLLVLEREFSSKGPFDASCRARLYHVAASSLAAGSAAKNLLWEADTDAANYEGMCLGPVLADGRRTLVLVSDGGGEATEYFLTLALDDRPRPRRWVQFIFDFRDDAQVVTMTNLVATAKAHGYNGVIFASGCALGMLHRWDDARLERLRRVKRVIDAAGMETAVGAWSFGYAKECFFPVDPNLAAAAPVFGTRYRVEGTRPSALRAVPRLPPPRQLLAAPATLHSPAQEGDFAKLRVKVTPARSYRLRIVTRATGKTAEWPVSASVRRPGAATDFLETRVFRLRTGEGTVETNDLYFASLAETELDLELKGYNRVYAGGVTVTSLELSETAPRLVIRRHGTPLTVRDAGTGCVYREGCDYAEVPRAKSAWPGPWNPPFELRPLPGGRIAEGAELSVDCYCSFPTWGRWASACMAAPEIFEIIDASAAAIRRELDPRVWCLSFDEVRAGGGCEDCRALGDMAHVYAECVKKSMAIVRRYRADAEFFVWNDLVDPYALADDGRNAGMYSSMKGVWDLLPPELGIGYWTYGPREAGMKRFSQEGRRLLVCAYYDEPELRRSLEWIDLARRTPGVTGIVYCTWGNNWKLLGEFGDRIQEVGK